MTQMNLLINRLTDVKKRLVVAKGRGKRRTESFELADANYREWINKVLLYSTRNYIQYPAINHHGKEYEKECMQGLPWWSSG